jgi:hypothetical protein
MKYLIVILILITSSACGKATASSARAETIPSPQAGFTCFIIYNAEGTAVGGNCAANSKE